MSGSSTTVQAPQTSPEENQLMQQQTNLLKQQQTLTQQSLNTQNLLAPYLYQSLGLTPQYGAKGQVTGFSQDPTVAANQKLQGQIETELLNREQQALTGNLPIDPMLTQQLNQSDQQLHSELTANLGPDYMSTTSGQTAVAQWNQYRANIVDSASRGDLTTAEGMALGQQTGIQQQSQFLMGGASGIAGMQANYGGLFGQAAQGYNNPLSIMENTRQMQFNASYANAANQASAISGIGSGVGSLAGMLGSAAILASSRDYKEELGDASDVLGRLRELPIRRWRYKPEMGHGTDPHIGPYAEDFRDRFGVGDGKTIALIDYLGVGLEATKELSEKVDKLSEFLLKAA